MCIITHDLEVKVNDDLSGEEAKSLVIHLGVGLIVGMIVLGILTLIFYRCYKKKVEYLKVEM